MEFYTDRVASTCTYANTSEQAVWIILPKFRNLGSDGHFPCGDVHGDIPMSTGMSVESTPMFLSTSQRTSLPNYSGGMKMKMQKVLGQMNSPEVLLELRVVSSRRLQFILLFLPGGQINYPAFLLRSFFSSARCVPGILAVL